MGIAFPPARSRSSGWASGRDSERVSLVPANPIDVAASLPSAITGRARSFGSPSQMGSHSVPQMSGAPESFGVRELPIAGDKLAVDLAPGRVLFSQLRGLEHVSAGCSARLTSWDHRGPQQAHKAVGRWAVQETVLVPDLLGEPECHEAERGRQRGVAGLRVVGGATGVNDSLPVAVRLGPCIPLL